MQGGKNMLEELRDVLGRKKVDFSVEELRQQEELSNYMYFWLLEFAVAYTIEAVITISMGIIYASQVPTMKIISIAIVIIVYVMACVFERRRQLCKACIEAKQKEEVASHYELV